MVSETIRFATELSRAAVQDQASRLSDLRTRAGTLLAAASIAGSFAGIRNGHLHHTVAVLALIAYAASVVACIYVLLPHKLSTEFRGTVLINVSREATATDEETFEAAVQWLEKVREDNAIKLDSLTRWYAVAALALGIEVGLWIIGLAT